MKGRESSRAMLARLFLLHSMVASRTDPFTQGADEATSQTELLTRA